MVPLAHKFRAPRAALALLFALGAATLSSCAKKEPEPPPPEQKPAPPEPKPKRGGGATGGIPDPLGGMLSGAPKLTDDETKARTQKFKTALVGVWAADLGDGVTEELTYTEDGAYTSNLKGPMPVSATGKYTITGLVGSKGLKLELTTATGTRKVSAIFEDNELHHPTLKKGVTGVFRKK